MKRHRLRWVAGTEVTPRKRRFRDYTTDARTSKAWILPDGRVALSSVFHFQWILRNAAIAREFGVPLHKLPSEEDPIRIAALRAGFVRLNYQHKSGTLVVEANRLRLTHDIKDALRAVVRKNLDDVSWITFNLLSVPKRGSPRVVARETVQLFDLPERRRVAQIPFL